MYTIQSSWAAYTYTKSKLVCRKMFVLLGNSPVPVQWQTIFVSEEEAKQMIKS